MRTLALCTAAIAALAALPAHAAPDDIVVVGRGLIYHVPPTPDRELATMRGGVALPNGLTVSIGIDIQTRVSGMLVLHTIYASDGPVAGVRVFTDGAAAVPTAPGTITVRSPGTSGAAEIRVSNDATGVTITPNVQVAPSSVNLVSGPSSIWVGAEGQTEVPVTANGPGVAAGPGTIALRTDDLGSVVTLDASTLQVRHLIGQATGVVIANTADNRTIDTVSSVNVDLQGSSFPVLTSLLAADNLALDIMRGR